MKNIFLLPITIVGFFISSVAMAIPSLQLDIVDGVYVGGDEQSTMIDEREFILQAFGWAESNKVSLDTDYYLSIAVIGADGSVADGTDFGSFSIDGVSSDLMDFYFGTPPVEGLDDLGDFVDPDLAPHDIFETTFTELQFNFDGLTLAAYDVQDGGIQNNATMYFENFEIDMTEMFAGFELHFDLYTYDTQITDFAPFSHDAGTKVPEPAMIALFGAGLIGLGFARRRRSRK